MIDITVTFNGRPFNSAHFADQLERAVIEATKKELQQKLWILGTTATGGRLQVDLKKNLSGNMDIVLSGPEELVEKAKKILS